MEWMQHLSDAAALVHREQKMLEFGLAALVYGEEPIMIAVKEDTLNQVQLRIEGFFARNPDLAPRA